MLFWQERKCQKNIYRKMLNCYFNCRNESETQTGIALFTSQSKQNWLGFDLMRLGLVN